MLLDEALSKLNISTAKFVVCDSLKRAERAVKEFGFPVVLKLISKDAVHKTEKGGVKLCHSLADVRESASKYLDSGKVLVQEYVEGVEFFIGIKKDPAFGPVLLAGVGGIFVEVFKDVSFRVCPIDKRDAEEMLSELKGKALLDGIRGKKPVNKKALIDAMAKLSALPQSMPNLVELDVNPIIINDKELKAVDARFVLEDRKQ